MTTHSLYRAKTKVVQPVANKLETAGADLAFKLSVRSNVCHPIKKNQIKITQALETEVYTIIVVSIN